MDRQPHVDELLSLSKTGHVPCTCKPFSRSYFLVSSLAGIDVWATCQPWQAAQRPVPQAVPLCLLLLALVALCNWVAFESTKGKMAPFGERAPQASPLESLSASLFSACRHFRLGGGRGPHPALLGSMGWRFACPGTELAVKLAGDGRVELSGEAGSAQPPCWVTSIEVSQLPPQAPDVYGLPPSLGSCTEKYTGAAALWCLQQRPGSLGTPLSLAIHICGWGSKPSLSLSRWRARILAGGSRPERGGYG